MGATGARSGVAQVERTLVGLGILLLSAYVVWTIPGVRPHPGFSVPFDGVLQGSGYVLAAVLALLGAWRSQQLQGSWRIVWWSAAGSVTLRAAGFVIALTAIGAGHPLGYPSVADACWVLSSVLLLAALSLRLRELAPRLPGLVVLDGTAAGLLVLGVATAVLDGPVRTIVASSGARSAVAVNLAYPVLDAVILSVVAALVISVPRRLRHADLRLLIGAVAFTVVDVVYLVLLADGTWRPGGILWLRRLRLRVARCRGRLQGRR